MPDEIDISPEEEKYLNASWDKIAREEEEEAAKQAQQDAAKRQPTVAKALDEPGTGRPQQHNDPSP